MRLTAIILGTFSLMLVVACGGEKSEQAAGDTPAAQTAAETNEVKWPELNALDDLMHRAERLLADADPEKARQAVADVYTRSKALVESQLPDNARQREIVNQMRSDLASLIESIEPAKDVAIEEARETARAISQLSHRIMASSGVPHKHGASEAPAEAPAGAHDHDHDHDHAH